MGRSLLAQIMRLPSFVRREDGVAIVEFALIVPVLLLIYFGTVEITIAMRNVRKVDTLSRTIGDTLSQRTVPTAAEVNDVFQVAPIILAPFDSTRVQMTVSAVGVLGDAETGPLQVCSSLASA
ncbi:MAG: pilus assembly protein, partial [Oxalobacteraceae bacterium]